MKTNKAFARQVKEFNERHPVGTRMRFWRGVKRGDPTGIAKTVSPAAALAVPVVWLEGESCIALTHVEPEPAK